jgi:uncharacterized membrane protein (TIGR02234 family)
MRRGLLAAELLCLLGSALVLLAVSRAWVSAELAAAAPLPSRPFRLSGTELAPGTRALGVVGLAGVAALPATRKSGRVLVGLLIAAAGVGIVAVLARTMLDPAAAISRADVKSHAYFAATPGLGPWPYVALLGAVLLAVAGVLVVVRGRSWAAMSTRYDAPAERTSTTETSQWEALDRGEDPTKSGSEAGG